MTDELMPRFLTSAEVCAMLRISLRTLYRLIGSHALPSVRVGRQLRIDERMLNLWLETGARPLDDGAAAAGHRASAGRPTRREA